MNFEQFLSLFIPCLYNGYPKINQNPQRMQIQREEINSMSIHDTTFPNFIVQTIQGIVIF